MSESKQPKIIVKDGSTLYVYSCAECGQDVEYSQPIVTAALCDKCRILETPTDDGKCETCGASPVVSGTGQCGPCCFGEADTVNGNW